jgi:cytochrome c oxidase cbb3-type subunit 3
MNNENEPNLLDHEYDGIRELDNKLPRWWVWLFYGTIIFAVIYLVNYHTRWGKGQLMAAEYQQEMKAGDALKKAAMSKFEASIRSLEPSRDQATIDHGHEMFLKLCAPCHRPDGGGLIGPNLCDDFWIHGSNFSDNVTTIWNGVPAKGMVTWKNSLKPAEVYAVASYIYTLRGTHPVNPKPPENQAPAAPAGPSQFE